MNDPEKVFFSRVSDPTKWDSWEWEWDVFGETQLTVMQKSLPCWWRRWIAWLVLGSVWKKVK